MSIETANAARFKKGMTALTPLEGELLEALEWAMSHGGTNYSRRISGQNDGFCDSVDMARATIAHAHGEQL